MTLKEDRERIRDAVQASGVADEDEELRGALVTGWYLISEWCDTNGKKWLARFSHENATAWQIKGWLHEALYGEDFVAGEGDDDAPRG